MTTKESFNKIAEYAEMSDDMINSVYELLESNKLLEDPLIIYEIIGNWRKFSHGSETKNSVFLEDLKNLLNKSSSIRTLFDSKSYEKEKNISDSNIKNMNSKIVTIKGIFPCQRCLHNGRNSTNTITVQIQTSSSDEPMTNFTTCENCSYKWKN